MHIIKEHIFGLKKQVKQQPHEEQGRVLVHDRVQVKGDILNTLPVKFGSEFFVALILVPVKKVNTFTIAVGSLRITLRSSMSLKPNLETLLTQPDQHENTLSIIASDGKHVYLHFSSNDMFDRWHLALREALVEMNVTESLARIKDGSLSTRKIEMAIQKCQLLVPADNTHIQKARRLLDLKTEMKQYLSRLAKNPQAMCREAIEEFLARVQHETVLQNDTQLQLLKSVAPKLYSEKALDALQAPITNNISSFSLSTSANVNESITTTLIDIFSPEKPVKPLIHLKSPIKNSFHQSLTEIVLNSTGRKKKVNKPVIKDFCNVLIDDSGASDVFEDWTNFESPSATPIPNKSAMVEKVNNSYIKKEKKRRNRIVKFHQSYMIDKSKSQSSSAEKKTVASERELKPEVELSPEINEISFEEVKEPTEAVVIEEIKEEPLSHSMEECDLSVPEDITVEKVVNETQVDEVELREDAIKNNSLEITDVTVDSIEQLVGPSVEESIVPDSVSSNDNFVESKYTASNFSDDQFEQELRELLGESPIGKQTTTTTAEEDQIVTDKAIEEEIKVDESHVQEVIAEVNLENVDNSHTSEITKEQETMEIIENADNNNSISSTSVVEIPLLTSEITPFVLEPIKSSDLTVKAIVTPIKRESELTVNEFKALTSFTTSTNPLVVPNKSRVSPEIVFRVRKRGRRANNKAFKSSRYPQIVNNENDPTRLDEPTVTSFVPPKMEVPRSPFREIGRNTVNMQFNEDKKINKVFPLLPSNSKAYKQTTNSLFKIDTPIKVCDTLTTTSVFTMRPAEITPTTESNRRVVVLGDNNQQQQLGSAKQRSPAEVLLNELTTKYKTDPSTKTRLSATNNPESEFNAFLDALMSVDEVVEVKSTPTVVNTTKNSPVKHVTTELTDTQVCLENDFKEPDVQLQDNRAQVSKPTIENIQNKEPSELSTPVTITPKLVKRSTKNALLTVNKDFTFVVNDKVTLFTWKKKFLIYGLFFVCLLPLLYFGNIFSNQIAQKISWTSSKKNILTDYEDLVLRKAKIIDAVRRDYAKALSDFQTAGGFEGPLPVADIELRIIVSTPTKFSRMIQLSKSKLRNVIANVFKAVGNGVRSVVKNFINFVTFKAVESTY